MKFKITGNPDDEQAKAMLMLFGCGLVLLAAFIGMIWGIVWLCHHLVIK